MSDDEFANKFGDGQSDNNVPYTVQRSGGGAAGGGAGGGVIGGGKGNISSVDMGEQGCNAPNGFFNEDISACECFGSWYGEFCENKHCADYNETLEKPDCSAHGMCIKGDCFCAAGWGQALTASGINVCADPVCPIDCGDHGICQDNVCICQDGWQGPACREPKCVNDCSGHGTCTFSLANSPGECNCEYGFAPPDCAAVSLYSKLQSCPNDCTGNGLCMNGKCVCQEGSFGVDCNQVSCPEGASGPNCEYRGCPRDCSGYGICLNGECTCDKNHGGIDCSIPMMCYDACASSCLADLTSSRCEICKGECLTMSASPLIGRHNPLRDRLGLMQEPQSTVSSSSSTVLKVAKRRHHDTVSAVQTSAHPHKKAHHKEVATEVVYPNLV